MFKKFRITSILLALLLVLALAASVSAAVRPTDPNERPAIKDVYKDYFLIGNSQMESNFAANILPGENTAAAMVLKHFNIITPNTALKSDGLWPQGYLGNPTGFTAADTTIRAAKARGVLWNGHTILWHNQSAQWPAPVTPAGVAGNRGTIWDYPTAKFQLERYISTVAGHFNAEDVKLYAYDVVNEAVKDNPENPADWRNALRTGFNPEERPSRWADAYSQGGHSWDYMYDAFLFTRQNADYLLNYNDFNDSESEWKATAIASMVKEFNERYAVENPDDPRKLVDVIGTQGHFDMRLNLDAMERTLNIYLPLGLNVDITELDVMPNIGLDKMTRIPDGAEMNEIFKEQGIYYAKLFMLFKEYAVGHHPEYEVGIHRVTWWRVLDPGYHVNGYLWTSTRTPKEGYWAVVDPEGYLEELDLMPGGPATFTFAGKDYKIRTWGDPHFAELDINVPVEIRNISFTAENVTLPEGFELASIKLDPADGAVRVGEPCHVTVKSVSNTNPNNTATYKLSLGHMAVSWFKDTSALASPNLAYAEVRFSDGVTGFNTYKPYYSAIKEENDGKLKTSGVEYKVVPKGKRATFILDKDNPIPTREKNWRLAKRIESGRTYMIVSAETEDEGLAFALTNRSKNATADAPRSLSRSRVAIDGDILTPLPHQSGYDNPNGLAQDNLKWVLEEMKSPAPGPYADQTGYTVECFIHGTNVYPQAIFRGNGYTGTVVNDNFELITRWSTTGGEGPQIADKALDRSVWFNTGIDPDTGETRMFMYSEDSGKHYVLKEVETGDTPARDSGNAISQRQSATGGFVAMRADSPDAGTRVKLYVYDIEPYTVPLMTGADASAVVSKLNSSKNNLTVTVVEDFDDGSFNVYEEVFQISNGQGGNSQGGSITGTYVVGAYKVYVEVKDNKVRNVYIVDDKTPAPKPGNQNSQGNQGGNSQGGNSQGGNSQK